MKSVSQREQRDIRDQSLKSYKIDRNFAYFGPQIILEWDDKTQPDFDHVTKFQGDQSRDLGERVAKK